MAVKAVVLAPLVVIYKETTMKRNEYESAEVCEIGLAEAVILGRKVETMEIDSAGLEPIDRRYEE